MALERLKVDTARRLRSKRRGQITAFIKAALQPLGPKGFSVHLDRMEISELLTDDDWDNLPDDGPEERLARILEIAKPKVGPKVHAAATSAAKDRIRHGSISTLLGVADHVGVSEIASFRLPPLSSFNENIWDSWDATTKRFVGRITTKQAGARKSSRFLALDDNSKSTIKASVARIRTIVEKSDLDLVRKKAIFRRLDDLLDELEKKRFDVATIAVMGWILFAGVGEAKGSLEGLQAAYQAIEQVVAPQYAQAAEVAERTHQLHLSTRPKPLAIADQRTGELATARAEGEG